MHLCGIFFFNEIIFSEWYQSSSTRLSNGERTYGYSNWSSQYEDPPPPAGRSTEKLKEIKEDLGLQLDTQNQLNQVSWLALYRQAVLAAMSHTHRCIHSSVLHQYGVSHLFAFSQKYIY